MVRKLTRRELRQRKASIKFAKTFIPLSLLLWLFKNLPYVLLTTGQYLDLYLGISDYTWSINQDDWCSGFREGSKGDGKVVVVTGANSGIGYPTAKNLALLGATKVVLGCRNKDKCSYAKAMIDAEVESLCFSSPSSPPFSSNVYDPSKSLDLSSLESVKSWVEEVGGVVPYVSHVALNAGVMSVPLEPRNEETGVEPQLHTNHVAHHYLTSLLLPSILSTPPTVTRRVLTVSSLAAHAPFSFSSVDPNFNHRSHDTLKAYGQSKRANLMFAHSLHEKLGGMGVQSVASHPGYSRTKLFKNNWSFAPEWLKGIAESNTLLSMSSEEGSLMSVRGLYDENLGSGCYVTPMLWAVGSTGEELPKEKDMDLG
eukprot:CAMPEP_0118661710 /NCGR_PEP_ID=MMETSP0785-20121206/16437_1 /TAXON_ID=91992 /ORGANISM="Bolidomonas pacifica, Strain CCMP 1866" /LENGTH=368 /DNA_ID=CAMNT_0006555193 /DNA_START=173 /DNA_END=1275 /DNA_ORIENTATION=+